MQQFFNANYMQFYYFLALWELFFKAFALWQAAKKDNKIMFGVILLINTVGILPIGYLIFNYYQDRKNKKETGNKKAKKISKK